MKQLLINNILSMYSYIYTEGKHPKKGNELFELSIDDLFKEQDRVIDILRDILRDIL